MVRVYVTFIVITVIIVTGAMDFRRACLVCWVRFGRRPAAAAVPPFSYKDVIDDILVIVIIGDKDAVYDILARDDGRHKDIVLGYPWRQKPEGHPGAPAARDSIFGGLGVVLFRQKDK